MVQTALNGHQKQTDTSGLTPKQALAAASLASGKKTVEVAKELHVNESTIRRWQKIPSFTQTVESGKESIFKEVLRGLRRQSLFILDRHLRGSPDVTPQSQIAAVRLILELHRSEELETLLMEVSERLKEYNLGPL